MTRRTCKASGIWLGLAVVACGHGGVDPADDDPEELRALLRDDPLALPVGVSRAPTPAITQPLPFFPRGYWTFDDCEPGRTDLFNAESPDSIAYRSVGVACAPGVLGAAVALAAREDIVYVPDQPDFVFDSGVSMAGWFRPTDVARTQTLFRKHDRGTSAFALVLHRGWFRFVVDLGEGRVAGVTARGPARAGVFQHVAASYDGAALRLYVDGEQVAERDVAGTIAPGTGPLLIGNDGSERRFDGIIDEAVFDLRALPAQDMRRLTCVPAAATVVETPAISAPTLPDVPAVFDIAVTNRNSPSCDPVVYDLSAANPASRIDLDVPFVSRTSSPLPAGATAHFTLTATPFDSGNPGTVSLFYDLFSQDGLFERPGQLEVVVSEPAGCHVSKSHELLITNADVIEDPIRVAANGSASDPRTGAWSFRHLVEEMAPTPADAPAMVEEMMRSFATQQVVNGLVIEARPNANAVLAAWPRTPDGRLDLARAPMRLKAIVNRIDLRDLDRGDAGQAHFIFSLVDRDGSAMEATLMFEYKLPAATEADVLAWAQVFHALGALPFSEPYNAALQSITDRIVRRGARAGAVNGSALHVMRSNEVAFDNPLARVWELRQFALSPTTGRLAPVPLDGTPDRSFNQTPALAGFITANRDAILDGTQIVPDQLDGNPFRAGAIDNTESQIWFTSDVDDEARGAFARGTCDGCHSPLETLTDFHHVSPIFGNDRGEPVLSPFLRGVTMATPAAGTTHRFNDLLRRKLDLESIVCAPAASRAAPGTSLRRGIRRIH